MTPMTTAVVGKVPETENCNFNDQLLGRGPDIQTLRATTFDDPLAREEVVAAFALRIGECTGLLGVTLEGITLDSLGNTDPSAARVEQGAEEVFALQQPLR